MKASPAKPLTRKTLSNLISIISKEQPQSQAPQAAPSTSRKPHIPCPPLSLPLSTLSVSLCLLLLLSKHSGDSERLFCSSFVSLKCALATWLQLFILLAEIYWKCLYLLCQLPVCACLCVCLCAWSKHNKQSTPSRCIFYIKFKVGISLWRAPSSSKQISTKLNWARKRRGRKRRRRSKRQTDKGMLKNLEWSTLA